MVGAAVAAAAAILAAAAAPPRPTSRLPRRSSSLCGQIDPAPQYRSLRAVKREEEVVVAEAPVKLEQSLICGKRPGRLLRRSQTRTAGIVAVINGSASACGVLRARRL